MAYSQKSINEYQKKNYYRVNVAIPAEHKEAIQAAAAARGVSVSRMVSDLIGRELGLDLALTGSLPGKRDDSAAAPEDPADN